MAEALFSWIDGDIVFKDGDVVWKDWAFASMTGITIDVTTPRATIGMVKPSLTNDVTVPKVEVAVG